MNDRTTQEILERVRRIETKVHLIGLKEGIEQRSAAPMEIKPFPGTTNCIIEVQGLDVTLAQLKRAVEAYPGELHLLEVRVNDSTVAFVKFDIE